MINQKTCTTFDTETSHLRRQGSSTLKQQISQSIEEKTTEKFEGAPWDILVTDYMHLYLQKR